MFHKKTVGLVQKEKFWGSIMFEIGYKNARAVAGGLNSQKFCLVGAKWQYMVLSGYFS